MSDSDDSFFSDDDDDLVLQKQRERFIMSRQNEIKGSVKTLLKGNSSYQNLVILSRKFNSNLYQYYLSRGTELNSRMRENKQTRGDRIFVKNLTDSLKPVEKLFSNADYIVVYRDQTKPWDNYSARGFTSTSLPPLMPGKFGRIRLNIIVPKDVNIGIIDLFPKWSIKVIEIILQQNINLIRLNRDKPIYVVNSPYYRQNKEAFRRVANNHRFGFGSYTYSSYAYSPKKRKSKRKCTRMYPCKGKRAIKMAKKYLDLYKWEKRSPTPEQRKMSIFYIRKMKHKKSAIFEGISGKNNYLSVIGKRFSSKKKSTRKSRRRRSKKKSTRKSRRRRSKKKSRRKSRRRRPKKKSRRKSRRRRSKKKSRRKSRRRRSKKKSRFK
jgi:hypothetical protein